MASDNKSDLEGSLETIKEILIGEHSRTVQKKINQLEERILREMSVTEGKSSTRTELLEGFVRKELEVIREELTREHDERSKAFERAMAELKSASGAFEQRMNQASHSASTSLRELREQILRQFTALSEDFSRRQNALADELERAFAVLDMRKPDRNLVAKLMTSMAAALQEENATPSQAQKGKVMELSQRSGKKSA
jgi:hypothetical protein